jgi:tripartite-type tricarboxylate transporter receptor subunit TctC
LSGSEIGGKMIEPCMPLGFGIDELEKWRIGMNIPRRMFIAGLGSAPILTLLAQRALAAFPERPIHLIVPFAAGGNADIVGRITGDLVSKALGQPVAVENRGGGGGSIGAEFVAHAAPDGYTLLVGSNGPLTVDPLLHANLGYDPLKDFAAVALTSYVPHALILSNKIPAKTMTELIAQSKSAAVTIATSGIGSATHMTLG